MFYYGVAAIVKIVSAFCFIYLSFWSLQCLNLEKIFKKGYAQQIKVTYILLAIALGYLANEFFFDIISLTSNAIFSIK